MGTSKKIWAQLENVWSGRIAQNQGWYISNYKKSNGDWIIEEFLSLSHIHTYIHTQHSSHKKKDNYSYLAWIKVSRTIDIFQGLFIKKWYLKKKQNRILLTRNTRI